MSISDTSLVLNRPRQIAYFASSLKALPGGYGKLDTNRLTLVHFAVNALDLLGVWDDDNDDSAEYRATHNLNKQDIIDWIYSLQLPEKDESDNNDPDAVHSAGFLGGTFLGGSCVDNKEQNPPPSHYSYGHIAMMYTALCTLKCLGDDWIRLNKAGIIQELGRLQLPDGSFSCIQAGSESDLRFLYCACAISHMLNDWSAVNQDLAVDYIKKCRSFDGGIAVLPGQEGHGGGVFCGVASLQLMGKLGDGDYTVMDKVWRKDLIRWCVHRQVQGMQGRPNKAQDTCYSYWIGGTLRLLGQDGLLQHEPLKNFVMKCQTKMGGFSKVLETYPDLLHSYYSLSYLSLSQTHFRDTDGYEPMGLKELNCTLGISMDRAALFQPLFP
jgi:geranylgeranyl transferase type-1 subunit beta